DRVASLLAAALRGLMGRSQQRCRLWVVAPEVTLRRFTSGDGTKNRLVFEGVHTCKSNNCPLCVRKWERTRAGEIQTAVSNWLNKCLPVVFGTFTMKHHPGMPLSLQHRLLTKAYGELWSGRKGRAFAELVGGKPESVRAHDTTWSLEHWWHPHLHSLMFFHALGMTTWQLAEIMDVRWRESLAAALRSFKRLIERMIGDERKRLKGQGCRTHRNFLRRVERRGRSCIKGRRFRKKLDEGLPIDPVKDSCPDCHFHMGLKSGSGILLEPGDRLLHQELSLGTCIACGTGNGCPVHDQEEKKKRRKSRGDEIEHEAEELDPEFCASCAFGIGECPNHRERATRMFGAALIPGHVPLKDSLIKVRKMLRGLTAKSIEPSKENGIYLEHVRLGDHVSGYLPKLGAIGFELASTSTKLGKVDGRGVRHYGKWEVAQLCAMHGQPMLRSAARRAWRQMYKATKGTATITFSDRATLGLGPDAYANGNEPRDVPIDEGETSVVIGHVDKPVWCGLARARGHAMLAAIAAADKSGALVHMSWLQPPKAHSAEPVLTNEPTEKPANWDELSAEDRSRWRRETKYDEYLEEQGGRDRRWERLREAARIVGPPAWRELLGKLAESDDWSERATLRGAEETQRQARAIERTALRKAEGRSHRGDLISSALERLEAEGLKLDPSLSPEDRKRRQQRTIEHVALRQQLVATFVSSGMSRELARRTAEAITSDGADEPS
ncbi:MAG: protein rep, partial [Polyangiaceae bacterium]